MKSTTRTLNSERGLTITEKLSVFRQKKDESRKENDAPSNKNVPPKIKINAPLKPLLDNATEQKPIERRKVVKQATHSSSTQPALNVTSKVTKTDFNICTKINAPPVDRKERAFKGRTRVPTSAEFKLKLDEYIMLAENAGNEVARSFIAAVPSEMNMKDVESLVLYWLTWIRLEGEAEEWEYVTLLFSKAKIAVKSLSGLQAISTAEQKHLAKVIKPVEIPETHQDAICNVINQTEKTGCSDSETIDCADVRMMMGEDGFSVGELSAPKTLRFSMEPGDFPAPLTSTYTESTALDTSESTQCSDKEKSPPKALGKYAEFLQNTKRTELSVENAAQPPVVAQATAPIISPKEVNRSVLSQVAALENKFTKFIKGNEPLPSIAASAAAELIMQSRSSISKKRKNNKSPGAANLDILLGLGGNGTDAEEEESDAEYQQTKRRSLCVTVVNTQQVRSANKAPAAAASGPPPVFNDLSARVSGLLSSAKFALKSQPGGKRGKGAQKVMVGVADIFSDDDEDVDEKEAPAAEVAMEMTTAADLAEGSLTSDVAPEEIDVTDFSLPYVPTTEDVDSAAVAVALKSRRSTIRRAAVSFAQELVAPDSEARLQGDIDRVTDSFSDACLASGVRRSRRLSNAGSVKSSAKKEKRRGTPHAAKAEGSRFSRPASLEGGKEGGSAGTKGSGSVDGMREDCGYGSYFSSMDSSNQYGEVEDGFDLLACTPLPRERRSRRLSKSAGKT